MDKQETFNKYCAKMRISEAMKELGQFIIDNIPLEAISAGLSDDLVILSICFYLKKLSMSRAKFKDYRVLNTSELSLEDCFNVTALLCDYIFSNYTMATPEPTTDYDHELLIQNRGL